MQLSFPAAVATLLLSRGMLAAPVPASAKPTDPHTCVYHTADWMVNPNLLVSVQQPHAIASFSWHRSSFTGAEACALESGLERWCAMLCPVAITRRI